MATSAGPTQHPPLEVLLVEDNPGDVDLVLAVLKNSCIPHRVTVACDGDVALAMLHGQGPHTGVPRPDLILLDLNLPRRTGQEVLADIKSDPALQHIPVVVLTSSDREREILDVYNLHANCFITKPAGLNEYWSAVRDIERFWFSRAQLPGPASR